MAHLMSQTHLPVGRAALIIPDLSPVRTTPWALWDLVPSWLELPWQTMGEEVLGTGQNGFQMVAHLQALWSSSLLACLSSVFSQVENQVVRLSPMGPGSGDSVPSSWECLDEHNGKGSRECVNFSTLCHYHTVLSQLLSLGSGPAESPDRGQVRAEVCQERGTPRLLWFELCPQILYLTAESPGYRNTSSGNRIFAEDQLR